MTLCVISFLVYISIQRGAKHLHVAMNSNLNQAYQLPPANGLTLVYAGISKSMNETMILPGESGNKINQSHFFCGQVARGYMPQ